MMSLRLQFAIVTLLAAALVGGWWWLGGWAGKDTAAKPKPRRTAATLVMVEPISLVPDRVTVRVVGTGKAIRSASIHPAVSGEVVEVAFKAGQRVIKGQALIRLDDKHQRLAVHLAQIAVNEMRRQVGRLEKLAPSGYASRARLQTARAELESAGVRLAQAMANLEDRTIYAPFDGVIGLTELDPGDRVNEDTQVASLDDRSQILVEFDVSEEFAGRIKVGDIISVKSWSSADKIYRGIVSATGSRIDRAMRSLRVQAQIANVDDIIRPGSSFDVQLDFVGAAYPSVREVAVQWSRDGAYLWRVNDNKAEKVFVTLVRRDSGRVLVDGALNAGDLVVVEGVQGLRLGQKVEAQPYQPDKVSALVRRRNRFL